MPVGMAVNLLEAWSSLPPFGAVQWFALASFSVFAVVWIAVLGVIVMQCCGRRAWRMLHAR